MARLAVENLTFAYPQSEGHVLKDISFECMDGTFNVICGESGCGKSTLLKNLKSVLRPAGELEGRVLVDGRDISDIPLGEQASMIGFVMQDVDAQIVVDKVWHEIAFGLESLGVPEGRMRSRVAEIASYFELGKLMHRDMGSLSGGQKQLVNLASVLVMQPGILILDEPLSQLDPLASKRFLEVLVRLNRECGLTIIMAEQDLDAVVPYADQLILIEDHSIGKIGPARDVVASALKGGGAMSPSMPLPSRLAFELGWDGYDGGGEIPLPLTVREARAWIQRGYPQLPPSGCSVPDFEGSSYSTCDYAIEIKDVWFRYSRHSDDVLKDFSLSVGKGAICALIGANGCGKSTLLKTVSKLLDPYRGSIRIFGKDISKWKDGQLYASTLAMLPQDPSLLFVKDSVMDDLTEHSPTKQSHDEAVEISRLFGIDDVLSRHPFDLSAGQLTRAAIVKLLMLHPRILILDEPTKGLDAQSKSVIGSVLGGLRESGVTVLLASHDLGFCAECADEIALLFDGAVASDSSPRGLFSSNILFTTDAARISHGILPSAVTLHDIVAGLEGLDAA